MLLALGIATRYPDLGNRNALALGMDGWRFRCHCSSVTPCWWLSRSWGCGAPRVTVLVQKQVRLLKGNGDIVQVGRVSSLVYKGAEHGDPDNFGDAP